jgi:STE24 endopeptidase
MNLGFETKTLASRLSFQILMVLIYPTVIQPLFNKLTPLSNGNLRERIESLASQLKFPLKHLYEIDGSKRSSHSNAYFFGLPWVIAFLSVTRGCLPLLL